MRTNSRIIWLISKAGIILCAFLFSFAIITISGSDGTGSDILQRISSYAASFMKSGLGNAEYGSPVFTEVLGRFPRTFILCSVAFVFSIISGVVSGMIFSFRADSSKRTIHIFISSISISIPDVMVIICLQMLMIFLKNNGMPYLPATGYSDASRLVLPALCLSLLPAFYISRITFQKASEAYSEPFVMTARAKGLSEAQIHWNHVFRKIRPGIIKSLYGIIPLIISNLLIVETIFYYPGLAYNLFKSLADTDTNLVMGLVLGLALIYILLSAFVLIVESVMIKRGGVSR